MMGDGRTIFSRDRVSIGQSIISERSETSAFFILQVVLPGIMMLPSAKWNQGIRHGPATYFHPNGNKEEETYVEGYEEVTEENIGFFLPDIVYREQQ